MDDRIRKAEVGDKVRKDEPERMLAPWLDGVAAVLATVWAIPWLAMVTILTPFEGSYAVQAGVVLASLWLSLAAFFIGVGQRRSRWFNWTIPSGVLSVICAGLGLAQAIYYGA